MAINSSHALSKNVLLQENSRNEPLLIRSGQFGFSTFRAPFIFNDVLSMRNPYFYCSIVLVCDVVSKTHTTAKSSHNNDNKIPMWLRAVKALLKTTY